MKNSREIKVGIVAIICGCLLYFGFHFLKGVNIFSATRTYVGMYSDLGGLVQQSPVYIRGYKVGQVDEILYDFTRDTAFRVTISVAKEIQLPKGTEMVLCSDGLLSGMAIKLSIPAGEITDYYAGGEMLPTKVEPGPMESLQEGLLTKVDIAVGDLDSLILDFRQQVKEGNLKKTLANAERITDDLIQTGQDLKRFTHDRLPVLVNNVDTAVNTINDVAANLREADLKATVARVNTTVDTIQSVLTSKNGTLGLLLNDKRLYTHIDSAVVSVDSLVTDLKANPKRYVHFSLFGNKDKKKK